jgi:O-antigen ligase
MTLILQGLLLAYASALWVSMAAMEIFGWLLFIIALIHSLKSVFEGKKVSIWLGKAAPNWLDYVIGLFFVSIVIGALLQDRTPWWKIVGDARWVFLLYGFTYILRLVTFAKWKKGFNQVWWAVGAAGLYGGFQFVTGIELIRKQEILYPAGQYWRATGLYNMSLTYGLIMGMGVALAGSYFVLAPDKRKVWSAALGFGLSVLGFFASLTRGAWIGLIIAMFAVILAALKRKALVPLVALALGLAIIIGVNDSVSARFLKSFNFATKSYSVRFDLWRANWELFKDHPLFGVGYGQSKLYVKEYYDRLGIEPELVSHAHNIYVQMLSTTGVIGFLCFLTISFAFLRIAWGLWKNLPTSEWQARAFAIGSMIALLTSHIAGLTESNFTDAEINHLMIFLWANLVALNSRTEPR